MRDVVVSTRPLSYRSAGSIRSLPTTCTHEARRGRGSYTTGREILSPLHPPTSLSLTRPLLSLSLSLSVSLFLLQAAFSPHSSKESKGRGRLPPPLRRNRGEQAPKFVLLFVDASKREPSRSRLSLFQDCPSITLGITRGPTRSFGWKF